MGCNVKHDKNKYSALLTFLRQELIYDARNYTWLEGDVMKTDDGHDRHQLQDIGEEGNIDLVTRILNLAHKECVEMLRSHTKIDMPKKQPLTDDKLKEPETYIIELSLPDRFSLTTIYYLEDLIHQYLVYRIVAEWISITYPARAEVWAEKLEDIRRKIRSAMNIRHTHKPLKPF